MSGIDDEALRAMLFARADRLAPHAAGEVLAGVRDGIRRPNKGGALAVLPVLTGRTPVIGAGWAAAAMVAVLVMVVVATRPPSASPSASVPASAAVVAPSVATSGPASPLATPVPSGLVLQPAHISITALHQALADRSLDGHLVVVDSTLRQVALRCAAPGPCPPLYDLDFVGPVVTEASPGLPVVPAQPAASSTPLAGTFVLVPHQGSLILVGRLEGSVASPVAVEALFSGSETPGSISLQAVGATLRRDVPAKCMAPCPNVDMLSDGTSGDAVTVASPAPGIDPTVQSVAGPFLVRTRTGSSPLVVARYDAGGYTVVDMPTVTCDVGSGTKVPPCQEMVSDALAALNPSGPITRIEATRGGLPCPIGARCGLAFDYDVTVRTPSHDWLVRLRYDPDGALLTAVPGPLVVLDGSPVFAPMTCGALPVGLASTLACDAAIAAALDAIPAGTAVVSLDFRYGSECPPWLFCALRAFDPSRGSVVVHAASPGRDLWVDVEADAAGVVAASAIPFPRATSGASPVP